ncbi:LacI family DNA-binding transcriptional regulator, partial [Paraburkholderia sp. SIMBA_053]
MPATRTMIARRAGVSVATVDRVLRDDQAVRPETAERVHLALANLRDERASRGRPAKVNSF